MGPPGNHHVRHMVYFDLLRLLLKSRFPESDHRGAGSLFATRSAEYQVLILALADLRPAGLDDIRHRLACPENKRVLDRAGRGRLGTGHSRIRLLPNILQITSHCCHVEGFHKFQKVYIAAEKSCRSKMRSTSLFTTNKLLTVQNYLTYIPILT